MAGRAGDDDAGEERSATTRGSFVRGQFLSAPALTPGLYVVATPIGNLSDISIRALDTLAAADIIACEDTRVTRKLLTRYGIGSRVTSYHEHSGEAAHRRLLDMLAQGRAVALVSDAGTPLISDPGFQLVADAVAAGHSIVPIPGPSAMTTALSAAGLPSETALFLGFLPAKSSARRKRLAAMAAVPATLVLYESPNRIGALLADAASELGGAREAAVCRELTKLHETFDRGTLGELATRYADRDVKGEIVLLVAPPGEAAPPDAADIDAQVAAALKTMSVKEAASALAEIDRTAAPRSLPARTRAEGPRIMRAAPVRDRRAAYRHGHLAEAAAAALLMAKGFRLLARRYKTPLGEIDLIVKRGKLIAFVEVKARMIERDALESVGRFGERRMVDAADLWLARHPDAAGFDLRYDMVLVAPWRLPRHLPDAFRPGFNIVA